MRNRTGYILLLGLLSLLMPSKAMGQSGIVEIDTTFSKVVQVRPTEHLLGIRYGYEMTGVMFSPDLTSSRVNTYKNISILYTYYHNLWDIWPYFGIQFGLKYCEYGFTTKYNLLNMDQTYTAVEIPLTTQLKYDVGKFLRLMVDLGGFAGYRIKTTNPDGFDEWDNRYDYGVQGGAGVAIKFHPFEIHIGALYQYSLCWLFKPDKLSSQTGEDWWLYSYPNRLSFNVGLFFNFD